MSETIVNVSEVFKSNVNARLQLHPNLWAGDDSAFVVRSIVSSLTDGKGNAVQLTPEDEDVINLASRPTSEVQLRVVRSIVAKHGATLDAATEKLVKRVISPTMFKIELAKAGKIMDSGSSDLKDLLD